MPISVWPGRKRSVGLGVEDEVPLGVLDGQYQSAGAPWIPESRSGRPPAATRRTLNSSIRSSTSLPWRHEVHELVEVARRAARAASRWAPTFCGTTTRSAPASWSFSCSELGCPGHDRGHGGSVSGRQHDHQVVGVELRRTAMSAGRSIAGGARASRSGARPGDDEHRRSVRRRRSRVHSMTTVGVSSSCSVRPGVAARLAGPAHDHVIADPGDLLRHAPPPPVTAHDALEADLEGDPGSVEAAPDADDDEDGRWQDQPRRCRGNTSLNPTVEMVIIVM